MNSTPKIFVLICVMFTAVLSEVKIDIFEHADACYIQYLKAKEKLNMDFPSLPWLVSRCEYVTPRIQQHLNVLRKDHIETLFPEDFGCVNLQFETRELIDLVFKIHLIDKATALDEKVKASQSEVVKKDIEKAMAVISIACGVDERKLLNSLSNLYQEIKFNKK